MATLAGLVVAGLAYRVAAQAAVPYGNLIRAAFDLHRFDLYEGPRWPLPTSATEERPAQAGEPPPAGQRFSLHLWRGHGADNIQFKHDEGEGKE